MLNLTDEEKKALKARGIILTRDGEHFVERVISPNGVFNAEQMQTLTDCAKKYGNGKIAMTTRLTVEVQGIPYENVEACCEEIQSVGLYVGGTSSLVRPVVSCKGSVCVHGLMDTQNFCERVFNEFYVKWHTVRLPHKFKIGIGGCPNSCMKPSLNDFGIEGRRAPVFNADDCRGCKVCIVETRCPSKAAHVVDGKLSIGENCLQCGVCVGKCPFKAVRHESETRYRIYVGGTWGKQTRMGSPLSRLVGREEIEPLLEKTMLWFKENAYEKERLGKAIDRIGFDRFEAALFSDDLLARKAEILAQPIKTR